MASCTEGIYRSVPGGAGHSQSDSDVKCDMVPNGIKMAREEHADSSKVKNLT